MQKPISKIFLDSSDPFETKKALKILGFLDGQTTNPSLVAKNPHVQEYIASGKRFTGDDLINEYKEIVKEISSLIPNGSVSIEVYCDNSTNYLDILRQAEYMQTFIPNAHIKIPANRQGLKAAEIFISHGGRVNMTLCFSQAQARAVELITKNAIKGSVFYSSFIGRLFDNKINGLQLLDICLKNYRAHNSNVEVLAASFRSLDQVMACLRLETDIVTLPFKFIKEWEKKDLALPGEDFEYSIEADIQSIFQEELTTNNWESLSIENELTKNGIEIFANDWNKLIS